MWLLIGAALAQPVAVVNEGLIAYVGDTVFLNGTASEDPDGLALTWAWSQASGPEVTLENGDSAEPGFTVEEPGTYRFALVVTNARGEASEPALTVVDVPYQSINEGGCAAVPAPSRGRWAGLLAGLALAGALLGHRRA